MRKRSFVSTIVVAAVILILIGGFISVFATRSSGAAQTMKEDIKQESDGCDVEVTAVIVSLADKEADEGSGTLYAPVYSFEYEGETYNVTGNVWENDPHYEAGQEVNILIDSSDPTNIYDPDNNISTALTSFGQDALGDLAFFMMVPISIMFAAVIAVVIWVFKNVKREPQDP